MSSHPKFDILTHVSTSLTASIVMHITYGHKIAPKDDPLVKLADGAGSMMSNSLFLGAQAVNMFPIRMSPHISFIITLS